MGRYLHLEEMWILNGCGLHRPIKEVNHPEAGQPSASCIKEKRTFCLQIAPVLISMVPKSRDRLLGEWNDTFFGTLAPKQDLIRLVQPQIRVVDAGCLGDTSPGSTEKQEQGIVAPPLPSCLIRRSQECGQVLLPKIGDHLLDSSLLSDCQNPLHNTNRSGIAVGDVLEEGLDGGKPGITGADTVPSLVFKVIQKSEDAVPIKVFH